MTSKMENYTRMTQAMALLADALAPFVERELKRAGAGWWTTYVLPNVSALTRSKLPTMPKKGVNGQLSQLDLADLLALIVRNWQTVFASRLPDECRSYAEELRAVRNKWAHRQAAGDIPEASARRAIETAALLLEPIDASAAEAIRAILAPADPAPAAAAPAPPPSQPPSQPAPAAAPPPSQPPSPASASSADAGLRPWREVVTPRPDVRTGRLTQSQFAADLHEVYRGNPEAGSEYLDAREFFARTYVTSGLRDFLRTALRRLTGKGGDPVVQLKTGFGGGKTHTMLALYHMARSGADIVDDVEVLKELSQELGVAIPRAKTAVLVGTKISATAPYDDDPELKSLGISLKTLWGHLAWQLGGWKAYQLVQKADDTATAPGEELRKVFEMASPCIILIDELVAYGRNLPTQRGKVPGGTLESLLSFLQTLTEMAKSTPQVIVAASIPESEMEIGGPQGEVVLQRIQQTFGRLETAWQPVQPEESFEVVRRRLCEQVPPGARDQAVSVFMNYYRQNASDFPAEVRERAYEERMKAAYPFHPELFDRLYLDWNGALPTFQSTRGVLRLLAGAVQAMWRENDQSALIMPATLRIDLPEVREELMRYLPPQFQSVIDSDIEGPSSGAVRLDAQNPRFGRVGAARACARAILLGSVPGKATKGIEDVRIRLGAARPGETIATYNDALNRLRDQLQYLHVGGSRYWFEVRPNLNQALADRMSRITEDDVFAELEQRLRNDRERGIFAGKHVAPDPGDVPDDAAVRLVVASPRLPHRAGDEDSPAIRWAREVLAQRGNQPRLNRNMLVFAAFDEERLQGLIDATRQFLAWKSIDQDKKALNLDEDQRKQAENGMEKANRTVNVMLNEGYHWALAPYSEPVKAGERWQPGPEQWRAVDTAGRLGAAGPIPVRVAAALQHEELLIEKWSPYFMREVLERWFWPQGIDHISARAFWEENLARYVYLPRLRDRSVIEQTIREGAATRDFFGYADAFDGQRYVGLKFGERPVNVLLDGASVIVRREVAERQEPPVAPAAARPADHSPAAGHPAGSRGETAPSPPTRRPMRRFYGRVRLNPLRVSTGAGEIAQEVIRHLAEVADGKVEVYLEISATSEGGYSEQTLRTVGENARTLKFESFGFEEE